MTEQELFEAWLIREFELKNHDYALYYVDGYYQCTPTQARWEAWQASTNRQRYKLVPVEPNDKIRGAMVMHNGDIDKMYKAMIEAIE